MTIDFTNPFPWLMDRHAPKYVAIGADPYRAVPPPDQRVHDAVSAVDLALYPTCPPTMARLKLLKLYEPALAAGHRRITLTPCFDAFVRDGLASVPDLHRGSRNRLSIRRPPSSRMGWATDTICALMRLRSRRISRCRELVCRLSARPSRSRSR